MYMRWQTPAVREGLREHTHTHTDADTHTSTHTGARTHTHTQTQAHAHAHTHTHTHTHVLPLMHSIHTLPSLNSQCKLRAWLPAAAVV